MKISASIYSDKGRELAVTIKDLVNHQVDLLHVDCNDNIAVFDDIQAIRKQCSLPIDLHIITEQPEKYFDALRATPVEYVTFQYEQLPTGFQFPDYIPGSKGLAIVTPTPMDVFDDYSDFDFLLVMATVPGQSGGVFDPVNFKKIRQFQKKYPGKKVHVDGGVNGEVSFILRNMGVHASVSGSFLFNAPSIGQALMDLTKREIESQFQIKDFMIYRSECPILQLNELTLESSLRSIESGSLGFSIVEEAGRFVGIISNADVRKALLKNVSALDKLDPQELINRSPVTIDEHLTVNEMLQFVRDQAISIMYLPVLNDKYKATGIVSFLNLIKGEI
jgi:pentose-5-phosphate-3-epimerase